MSKVGDFTDWDYSPAVTTAIQAVAGNDGSAFQLPDKINTLIDSPLNDVLIFGCDHGIYQCTGDPAAGGSIDLITNITGMAWGESWCRDNSGTVYFFGSRGGVYRMPLGYTEEDITQFVIPEDLADVNLSTHLVKMVWDDRQKGFYVFISPLTAGAATHWFYDARNRSWWKDVFADNNMNPVAVHVFDGDAEADRIIFLGGEDSRVRYIDYDGTNDDTSAISSYCYFGPFNSDGFGDAMLTELQVTLGVDASRVVAEIFSGDSTEAAYAETLASFTAGLRPNSAGVCRNLRTRIRGDALFLRLSNTTSSETWSFEQLTAKIVEVTGRIAKVRS